MRLNTTWAMVAAVVLCLGPSTRPAFAQTGNLAVSQQSSAVGFTVFAKKLFTFKEEGQFKHFEGEVNYNPSDPGATRVDLTVYTNSVDTRDREHDAMLRSADFFDVDRFPTMHFASTTASLQTDGHLVITGDLTIRGIKKPVDVPVRIQPGHDSSGLASKFDATFEIDRTEFGLNGTPTIGGFNVTIARKVQIHLAIAVATPLPRFK